MKMRVYIKTEQVSNIELDLDVLECFTIKNALELYASDEDIAAINRIPAVEMLKTMAEDRETIDIDDLP